MAQSVLINSITFTQEQQQVLNGALLGDGSLYIHNNGGKNAQLIYTSKSKEHVLFVMNYFQDYWSGEGLKSSDIYDNRTQKNYHRYTIKTYTNESFTKYYNEWYINNKKQNLPKDLVLTPLTCLIWYIGDGAICHSKQTEYIKLATQSFSKEQQEEILLPQLKNFEASLMKSDKAKYTDNQQYFIYIPRRCEKDFLQYIGNCPISDYAYKWAYTEYKNKKPISHKEHELEFCEMYKSGMTYYAIAKHFNIEPNAVKYYLKKHNLY